VGERRLVADLDTVFTDPTDKLTFTAQSSDPVVVRPEKVDSTLLYVTLTTTGFALVTVTADDGNETASTSFSVSTQGNQPPEITSLTVDTTGSAGITFTAEATDDDDATLFYLWDFGDSADTSGVDLKTVRHVYASARNRSPDSRPAAPRRAH